MKKTIQQRVRLFSRFARDLQPHRISASLNPGNDHSQSNGENSLCSKAQTTENIVRVCMSSANFNCPRRRQIWRKFNFHKIKKMEQRKNKEQV